MQERDNALSLLIEKSIDLKGIVVAIDEKVNSILKGAKQRKGKMSSIPDLIQDLELQVQNIVNINGIRTCND